MVKTTIEVEDGLWRRFSLLVLQKRGERKKNEVIAQLLKEYVEQEVFPSDPQQLEHLICIEEMRASFLQARNDLIRDPRYNGKYVAVLQGAVVDCDEDKRRLARRVYERHGYIPIYIDMVAPSERRVEIPSPELASR